MKWQVRAASAALCVLNEPMVRSVSIYQRVRYRLMYLILYLLIRSEPKAGAGLRCPVFDVCVVMLLFLVFL